MRPSVKHRTVYLLVAEEYKCGLFTKENVVKKILNTEIFEGMLTVDIEGELCEAKIGDLISDDTGNVFRLDSVALYGGVYNRNIQTLVLTKLEGEKPIGSYLIAT